MNLNMKLAAAIPLGIIYCLLLSVHVQKFKKKLFTNYSI